MPLGEALTLRAARFSCLSAQEQKTKTELLPGVSNCMDMTENISKRGEGRQNSRETFKGRCENIDLYLCFPLWVISSLLWPQSSRLIYDAVVNVFLLSGKKNAKG